MRRSLNTNVPEALFLELEDFCKESGYSKTQAVIGALTQYLAIKQEERIFREMHPTRKVKTHVTVEAVARENEPQKKASVLIY